jgi:fructoselysine-6-P-deglycase FrlB-like protein
MTDILDDILEQPQLLAQALHAHLAPNGPLDSAVRGALEMRPRRIILTGMGSSLFAAYPAYLRLLQAGLAAIWIELSELLHYAGRQIGPDTLLVVISQSGETVEALRLLEELHPSGSLLAITNNADSTLAGQARWVIATGAGAERSIATKTYTTSLLALTMLAARIAGTTPRELAGLLEPAIAAARSFGTGRSRSPGRTTARSSAPRPARPWRSTTGWPASCVATAAMCLCLARPRPAWIAPASPCRKQAALSSTP